MNTYTIDDFIAWGTCKNWTPNILNRLFGEGWSGTCIDVINNPKLPIEAKIWVLIMCGEISDSDLEKFCNRCKSGGPLKEKTNPPTKMPQGWKNHVNITLSPSQDKAMIYFTKSLHLLPVGKHPGKDSIQNRKNEVSRQLDILASYLPKSN